MIRKPTADELKVIFQKLARECGVTEKRFFELFVKSEYDLALATKHAKREGQANGH